MVSSAYLRLLIFLPPILIPACASSSPAWQRSSGVSLAGWVITVLGLAFQKVTRNWRSRSFVTGRVTGIFSDRDGRPPCLLFFLAIKEFCSQKEDNMCSLMWLRKKRATPHFKMLCRTASRSISLEERARRLSFGSNERSLSNTWRISDSGGILSFKEKHKSK